MDQQRSDRMLARIDAALDRIEAACARPLPGDSGLREKHEQLRAAVSRSLRQLDMVIAAHESEGAGQ